MPCGVRKVIEDIAEKKKSPRLLERSQVTVKNCGANSHLSLGISNSIKSIEKVEFGLAVAKWVEEHFAFEPSFAIRTGSPFTMSRSSFEFIADRFL